MGLFRRRQLEMIPYQIWCVEPIYILLWQHYVSSVYKHLKPNTSRNQHTWPTYPAYTNYLLLNTRGVNKASLDRGVLNQTPVKNYIYVEANSSACWSISNLSNTSYRILNHMRNNLTASYSTKTREMIVSNKVEINMLYSYSSRH